MPKTRWQIPDWDPGDLAPELDGATPPLNGTRLSLSQGVFIKRLGARHWPAERGHRGRGRPRLPRGATRPPAAPQVPSRRRADPTRVPHDTPAPSPSPQRESAWTTATWVQPTGGRQMSWCQLQAPCQVPCSLAVQLRPCFPPFASHLGRY